MHTCGICKKSGIDKTFTVREMHFGTRDVFEYFECDNCGCVQIVEIPAELGRYYPRNYYSYSGNKPSLDYSANPLHSLRINFLNKILTRHYFSRRSSLGHWIAQRSSLSGDYPYWLRHKKIDLGVQLNSSILDVGTGAGKLLLDLSLLGFTNLTGIDPYIEQDVEYSDRVRILKRELKDMDQQFDLVMFNHSFEHMPDPIATLRKAYDLVKPGRFLIIRVPLAGSYAWRKYGVNWVALDAPRHFYLHTPKSFAVMAAEVGFEIADIVFDGDGFAHWGSEMYLRDIPLIDEKGPSGNGNQTLFTARQLTEFVELDERLNRSGEADKAAFCLYKK